MIPLLKNSNSGNSIGNKNAAANNRRKDERTEIAELSLKKTRQLIYIYSTLIFGICLLCIIVGILYLTAYFYRFSFVQYTTTITASLFVSFGTIILSLVVFNGILIRSGRYSLVLLTALATFVFFTTLLGIGIWGLAISDDERLNDDVRRGITVKNKKN